MIEIKTIMMTDHRTSIFQFSDSVFLFQIELPRHTAKVCYAQRVVDVDRTISLLSVANRIRQNNSWTAKNNDYSSSIRYRISTYYIIMA